MVLTSSPPSPRPVRPGTVALDTRDPDAAVGPFAIGFGTVYIIIAFVLAGPAYPFEPWVWTITLAFAGAAVLLAPREHLRRMVFDGPILLMGAWITLSLLWTRDPDFGLFNVRRDMPLLLAVSLVASLLPRDSLIRAIRLGLATGIGLTVIALIVDPSTRSHASDGIYLDDYPGWHGWFQHKNVLAPYLIFALITTLTFERNALARGLWLAVIGVLLIGSDSATGMSAAVFVVAIWVWFRLFHRSEGRWTAAFVVSSVSVGICAAMVAVASLGRLAGAYGKDLTFSGRTFIWDAVLNAISEEPWVGYGVGGVFWDPRSDITRSIWRDIGFSVPHSHSGVLDVWLGFGIIGLGLFSVVFVTSTAMGVRLIRRSPLIGEWLLLLLSAQFLIGLSENVFLGGWLTYMAIVRACARRELNELERADLRARPAPTPIDEELLTSSGHHHI